MSISKEIEANILRYYHVEKWRVGTIARQLSIHHSVVDRVLRQSGVVKSNLQKRACMIDEFLPFIMENLEKHPTLCASRLYSMVRERGYKGSRDHFRHMIALYRPQRPPEAFLRLKTLPGEQGQVDWGHFGHVTIGKAKRPLMAFVMVLSFSRKVFLRFYLNYRMDSFLNGHEEAFKAFGGVPKVLLYDNLKSMVLERKNDAIRFNSTMLNFAGHYRFEARPVAVARGNEKGRVERAIRYIRENFFAARTWKTIDDLNAQAEKWCLGESSDRPCPGDKSRSVRDVFEEEKLLLLPFPANPYPTGERQVVKSGKTPYIRFDLNDYSIPHVYTRKILTVVATQKSIVIMDETKMIATHDRSYDKGQQVEDENHIKELRLRKKKARFHGGQDRLSRAVPSSEKLLIQAADRGYPLRSITQELLLLLDKYGASEVEAATKEAILKDVPHPNSIRLSLERRRDERQQLPPIKINLPDDERVRNLVVVNHDLNNYDTYFLKDEKEG